MSVKDEKLIDIILLAGSGTICQVTLTFNATRIKYITLDSLAKHTEKFKRTGFVANATRSGRWIGNCREYPSNEPDNGSGRSDQRWKEMKICEHRC